MAKKKISYNDIAEDNLFDPVIKGATDLLAVLSQLEKQLKEVVKSSNMVAQSKPLNSYKNIKEVEQAVEELTEAQKSLQRVEAERIKLQARLLDAQSDQIKKNAILRVEIEEQNKANKEAAKQAVGIATEAEKLAKKVADTKIKESERASALAAKAEVKKALEIERAVKKEAAAKAKADAAAEKEAKRLSPEYAKQSAQLNELRKKYKELALTTGENTKESKELLKEIVALDTKLKKIDASVGQFQRSVGNYEKAVKGLTGTLKALGGATGVLLLLDQLKSAFASSTTGSAALEKGLARVTVTVSVFVGTLITAFQQADGLLDFFEKLQGAFVGFEDRVIKAIEAQDKAIDTNTKYAESVVGITQSIAALRKQQADLAVISEDNTLSFETQSKAGRELIGVTAQLAEKELQLVNMRLMAVNERRKAAKIAGVINAEIEQEYADLLLEQADKQAELAEKQGAIQKKLREDRSDEAELTLDLLIDTFDREKTVNERRIADETINFEKRRALLIETERLALKAFNDQVAKLQEFTDINIDANALVAESDAAVIDEQIKRLGLSEILRNRLREVVQERKVGLQDLTAANKLLAASEISELKAGVALQQEALLALQERGADLLLIQKRLAEKTLVQEKENILQRLLVVEAGSEEALRLQGQLNDLLLKQQEDRLTKEKEAEQKALEAKKQSQEAAFEALKSFNDKRADEVTKAIDRDLEASKTRQSQLEALAAQGSEKANENLAIEQKRQAELEAAREKAIARQRRVEFAISAIQTYSAKVQAGEPNALASTIQDISVLQAFINSLPAFYEGTENVADAIGAPDLAGRDGYIIRADGRERILNGAQNDMIPKSVSNFELAMLGNMYANGKIGRGGEANGVLESKLDRLIQVTENKPVYLGRDYNATERAVVETIESRGRLERAKQKVGKLF